VRVAPVQSPKFLPPTTASSVVWRHNTCSWLWLSFDEWNVWYRARGGRFADGQRKVAPPLLEEVYNLEDALLVGGFLNTLLRQSGRARGGCLAQIVTVIAPLVTNETSVLRQSILEVLAESETYPIRAEGLRPDFARDDRVPTSTSPRPSTRRTGSSACSR